MFANKYKTWYLVYKKCVRSLENAGRPCDTPEEPEDQEEAKRMDDKGQFRENLNLLLQIAATEGNRISKEQVQGCFEDLTLTEEQWDLIYHYLELNKVEVIGHVTDAEALRQLAGKEDDTEEPGAETAAGPGSVFLEMYREELSAICPLTDEEEVRLLVQMREGCEAARDRLIEGKLDLAARVAKEYIGRGLGEADLIQEGNMGLILALDEYQEGPLDAHLEGMIRKVLEAALEEDGGREGIGNYLAGQANTLLQVSTEMAEELGREATVEELARRLNISEELVREIMKMSLDAVNAAENGKLSRE